MILIILILSISFSFAQDCSEINLIKEENSPFEKIPVYDQNGTGMCYAYGSSQLANFELIKRGEATGPVVHPGWVGMNNGANDINKELRGGFVQEAINSVRKRGNCDYDSVTTAIGSWARTVGVSEARILAFIDDYGRILRETLQGRPPTDADVQQALKTAAQQKENLRGCSLAAWTKIFGDAEFLANNAIEVADRLLLRQCQTLAPLNLPEPTRHDTGDDQLMRKTLSEVLQRGRPVAMDFCSWAADRPSGTGNNVGLYMNTNRRTYTDPSVENCGAHVALVAGRKMVNNKCSFLYLNSRGSGWIKDNRHLTCLCREKKTGKFVDECTYQTHNNGKYSVEACWVPEEKLIPNIRTITYF